MLKESIVILRDDLINKSKEIKIYTTIQIYSFIIFISGFLVYYFYFGERIFNRMANTYEFFFLVIIFGILNIILEKVLKVLKEQETKLRNKLKDSMILKVCECDRYCECKEELNKFIKNKGSKVI